MANNGYDPNQPRDKDGRWTSTGGTTEYRQNTPYEEITKEDRKRDMARISLRFFGEEKALKNQSSISLQRGIRNLNKRISEHKKKIKNPIDLPYWKKLEPARKRGLIVRWKKEIINFQRGIAIRKEELIRRGEKYD